jgi:predicted CoA-binding protein
VKSQAKSVKSKDMNKKTIVLGATPDASRYAYLAANRLVKSGHDIINVGIKTGEVAGVPIENAIRRPAEPAATV